VERTVEELIEARRFGTALTLSLHYLAQSHQAAQAAVAAAKTTDETETATALATWLRMGLRYGEWRP